MDRIKITIAIFLMVNVSVMAQQPRYTAKHLKHTNDGTFKNVTPVNSNGKVVSYIVANTSVFDIDDDNSTYIGISDRLLLCFEGTWKNGKKEGVVIVYVIDSLNRDRRYKVWEQEYKSDKMNVWRYYTLRGTLKSLATFQNDSLNGIARQYGVNGEIVDQREYLGSSHEFIRHSLYPDGTIKKMVTMRNGRMNGVARSYYQGGKVMEEEVNFKDDIFHGSRKYFYPNGQLWIEQIYRDGLSWEVIANFTEDGKRRDAGTLRNGNGTVILYNANGSVESVTTFVNGKEQ